MEWLVNHWQEIFTALTAIVTAASLVANLTPTQADNKVVDAINRVINALALNFKAK
jgi:hypothetical protein